MLRAAAMVVLASVAQQACEALILAQPLPTAEKPCKAIMKETKAACDSSTYGSSDDACHYGVCYTAELNRNRCDGVETDVGRHKTFAMDLDALLEFHGVECEAGEQGGTGVRNARFDCKGGAAC